MTEENANDARVGVVSNVWFNDKDGWYWCDGIIWDKTAQNLITDKGWSVSCSYDVKLADDTGGSENNIPYNIEFLDGVFTHLAIVDNPRYERANIVFNSKTEVINDKWITIHPNGEDSKGRPLLLKDGENVYEAMQRQWGISSPGQQHLFSVSKYKTDDNYKKELEAKIAELNEQVEKSRQKESKRKEEKLQKDAEILMLDKFLRAHLKSFGGEYFKAIDFWEKHNKDYHTKAENGGSGSGNFDHDGRPGQVGGSLPYDSKFSDKQNEAFFKKWENAPEIKLKPSDWDNISDIKNLRQEVKKYLLSDMRKIPLHRKELGDIRFSGKSIDEFITYSADRDKLLAAKQLPQFIEEGKLGEYFDSPKDRSKQDTIKGFYPIYFNLKTSTNTRKAEILIAKDDNGKLFFDMFLDYDRDKAQLKRALNGNLNPVALNNIITDIQEDFNPDIKNNVQNNKEQDMALIDELKKLITKVENEKPEGENMDDDKKIENEKVDKRDIIRQIMAIAGKREDDEDVRTIAKLAEKLAYDKSEAGSADNKKVKNAETKEDEEKYEDLKKDVKKDVENKCKNSVDNAKFEFFDKMNEIFNAAMEPPKECLYVSRQSKLEAAKEYFG